MIILVAASCESEPEYSYIPGVSFKSFEITENNDGFAKYQGLLQFDFVDGDGNIGLPEINLDTVQNQENIPYDCFIQRFKLAEGNFIKDGSVYRYRIPFQEQGEYYKHIKGTIKIEIPYAWFISDTIRYEFYITDRDLNESNIAVTDTIIFSRFVEP